ncbi:MAG: hypothetical protein FH751_01400 [Firmicutes bacterium]|nr:hypothetical protein [Bacillota bacterium]
MKISELNLISFGKFNNKVLNLKDGINIIYGNNEAGKSTVHKFIEGMFFGFFKPYTKTKRYSKDYYRFEPWYNTYYKGSLKYNYDNETYRIDRNFTKGDDHVKVIDDLSGEDISKRFLYDDITRVIDPSSLHLGVNNVVYKNTLSIKQLGSETDKNLSKEIKDKLANLGGTLDEEISIKKILRKLDTKINDIGTKKRIKTSPYGKLIEEINKLENKRENILKTNDEAKESQIKLKNVKDHIEKLNLRKKSLEEKLLKFKQDSINRRYLEAKKVLSDINELQTKLETFKKYKDISEEDYSTVLTLENSLQSLRESLDRIKIKEDMTKQKLDKIKGDYDDTFKNKKYKHKNFKDIKRDVDKEKTKLKNINLFKILISFVFLGSILIGFLINTKSYFITLLSLILLIYFNLKSKKINFSIEEFNDYLSELVEDEKLRINLMESERIIEQQHREQKKEILDLNEKIKERNVKLNQILVNNNCLSIDDFNKGIDKLKTYDKIIEKLNYKREILTKILEDRSFEELEKEANRLKNSKDIDISNVNKDSLENDLKEIRNELIEKEKLKSRLEEKIDNLSNVKALPEINEEIEKKINLKKKYEKKLDALNTAKNTLDKVSKNIHKDFAPKLNKKVASIIKEITEGKYYDIKIDQDINVKVIDSNKNDILNVDSLSKGTIDQIYFSLRLGIIDTISKKKKLPLILDDCFSQYDKYRLKNILKLLYKLSKERQIIIFTCHLRESEMLKDLNVDYNYVKL